MANKKISQLPLYTGDTTGVYLVMDNAAQTVTYKVTKETLVGASGTSGTSGSSGSSGTSGSNGTSGSSGSSGTSGSSGSAGASLPMDITSTNTKNNTGWTVGTSVNFNSLTVAQGTIDILNSQTYYVTAFGMTGYYIMELEYISPT
jgi:hypothetical protein